MRARLWTIGRGWTSRYVVVGSGPGRGPGHGWVAGAGRRGAHRAVNQMAADANGPVLAVALSVTRQGADCDGAAQPSNRNIFRPRAMSIMDRVVRPLAMIQQDPSFRRHAHGPCSCLGNCAKPLPAAAQARAAHPATTASTTGNLPTRSRSSHWRARCRQTGTAGWGGGRWKRTASGDLASGLTVPRLILGLA
jgi:hypothetical protein